MFMRLYVSFFQMTARKIRAIKYNNENIVMYSDRIVPFNRVYSYDCGSNDPPLPPAMATINLINTRPFAPACERPIFAFYFVLFEFYFDGSSLQNINVRVFNCAVPVSQNCKFFANRPLKTAKKKIISSCR